MDKLTKAYFVDAIYSEYQKREISTSHKEIKENFDSFLDVARELIVSLHHIKIKKHGWLGALFKPGGRPVRNPKSGQEMVMRDTYSVRVRHKSTHGVNKIFQGNMAAKFEEHGIDPKFTKITYHELVRAISEKVMIEGGKIELRGFGVFERKTHPPRSAMNPKKRELVQIGERHVLNYKASKVVLKEIKARHGLQ